MSIEFELPNIGEGVESADIAEIMISPGDTVTENQIIMELETEKAVVELPITLSGTIDALHVGEGETVEVGQSLLSITPSDAATDGQKMGVTLGLYDAFTNRPLPVLDERMLEFTGITLGETTYKH